ncbi:NAD(P)/FAD-dependent oxidoreductase, partial [Beijerinckia sp. L45]|uniref:NAD(P)/FAD-dependent oxidoreductase n=1 Tax=Beijerinckia sp. L45 TaxID=1641855 RepID=UPI00131C13B3
VVSLDTEARTITFEDGRSLSYDSALLATGGVPRPFDVPGHALSGVHLLRTPADAEAIVRTAEGARRAVVVGAGFIGLEAAASLRERGLDVTVVAPQTAPLEDRLGTLIGNVFRRVHEREGIVFQLGQEVEALEGEDGRVTRVRLKGGAVLEADLVLAGLGVTPATDQFRGARREDGGLAVDAHLKVVDGLYAAGDIAAFPLYGNGPRTRVEHWRVAEQHGRVAALNMIGQATPYDAVPVFWTIGFLKRLDYVGHAATWDDVVVDGDLEKPDFLAFYVEHGAVKALAGWGRDRQMAEAVGLMAQRRNWTVPELRQALR